MDRSKTSVLVAHPGAAHFIYELVAAVQALGFDGHFETGFYYDPEGSWARLLKALPPGAQASLEREFRRRTHGDVDAKKVSTHALYELLYVAAARKFKHRPALPTSLMNWRNRRIDTLAADRVLQEKPKVVIGHDTSAIATLKAAKQVGSLAVLNQMIGHVAVGDRILSEEAALHPDWADSLHAGAPKWLIDQCIEEARLADLVLAPSEYVKQTMIEVGTPADRIEIIPFGVRVDRFSPPENGRQPDGKFRLLYVGQISQRKGLKYVLEAIKQIGDRSIELLMVGGMVGEGKGLKPYDGWYRHIPNVPHSEVPGLFRTADLFVYPSLHEGSANAIFEGMASGLPVLTTLNSGSMVRDGIEGHILPIRDVDALAEKILAVRNDADKRAAMGRAARVRALQFTWDHYRARLGQILDGRLD
ncbi:glycosyltransferase family 4 protein [Lacibacterium aquatile]|uniref:Glycosyltransferase family 4 protein n=1 Tax=Lacibacterium aquatile TaxID=1168082 RepID=A0ABW5DNH7_9PROT